MDLRRRLAGLLALLLGGLLALTTAIQLYSLRADIEAEVTASTRLVEVLLAAGANLPDSTLHERLANARLRHLAIRTVHQPAANGEPHPLPAWLGLAPSERQERAIRIGDRNLYIAPNPHSEIDERLASTVRIWITLLCVSGATCIAAWWCADRALAPVRELEDGLQRLARGEPEPRLPAFSLREFGRVAHAIDVLAAALAEARAARHNHARQLIAVQEDERRTLARDLHDEMGQTLTALNVTASYLARHASHLAPCEVADCAGDLRRDLRTGCEQLRAMLRTLRPHGLHASGLAQALQELVAGWHGRQTGITFALDLPPALPAIDDATRLAIYRVVQEALTNVVRHSGARHCTVRLATGSTAITLEIIDDGRGLPANPRWHGGLPGMRERVAMVGGELATLPAPAGGLRVCAVFPLATGSPQPIDAMAEVPA